MKIYLIQHENAQLKSSVLTAQTPSSQLIKPLVDENHNSHKNFEYFINECLQFILLFIIFIIEMKSVYYTITFYFQKVLRGSPQSQWRSDKSSELLSRTRFGI